VSIQSLPKDDPRTVDELVNAALGETDEEIAWNAVCALHWNGTFEALCRAEVLCASHCAKERRLGADILGQLGIPERTFPKECCELLRAMLKVSEVAAVLQAVLVALSHQNDADAIPIVANFSTHPDSEVRHAAVLALSGHETPLALESLISLSNDAVAHVRDWATFALGTLVETDTPAIRHALADRLDDSDNDTRGEALVGLAARKDERVVEALKRELSSECIGSLAIEAAELIGSAELHSHLIALQDWWDVDPELLERAISATQP